MNKNVALSGEYDLKGAKAKNKACKAAAEADDATEAQKNSAVAAAAALEDIEAKIKEMYSEGEFVKVVSCISGRKKYKLEFLSQNEVSVGSSMINITRFFALIWVFSFYEPIFNLISSVSATVNS